MRKLIISILAILYLGAATGASINIHYCMDKMVGAEWGTGSDGHCSKCGMEKNPRKDNCCKNEQKLVKINLDQKTTNASIEFVKLVFSSSFQYPVATDQSLQLSSITEEHPLSNAPPDPLSIAVYKLHCKFRI